METFTAARAFVQDPHYGRKRQTTLADLDPGAVDPPMVEIIRDFNSLPQCFTLQSCWGHFLLSPSQDSDNLERLPLKHDGPVDYRIAIIPPR